MHILTIKTNEPISEIAVFKHKEKLNEISWEAHRTLSDTIFSTIEDVLSAVDLDLHMLEGIIVFSGPGSFTGLRIGITVANTLAQSLDIPIVGATEDTWQAGAIDAIMRGENQAQVLPEYGADPHITQPRK